MAFSTELLTLMPSTIKVSTRSGHDNYGAAQFAASTTNHRCRVLERPGFIRGRGEEEIAYRDVVWARSTGSASITASDRVTLPDGTIRPVVKVERYPDDDGENHVKIFL
jgi:hypothetical protein